MHITTLNLIFLLFVLVIANIVYKGRTFDRTSWKRVIALSLWFIICGIILLGTNYQNLLITINFITVGSFIVTTLVWFIFPGLTRHFGTYPSYYFKNKKGNTRFMVKFESPSMTIKYFEVSFQQVTFLFLRQLIIYGLQMDYFLCSLKYSYGNSIWIYDFTRFYFSDSKYTFSILFDF